MLNISNQKPIELSPLYNSIVSGDYAPLDYLNTITATPILNSKVNPNSPVSIQDNNNLNLDDADNIVHLLLDCSGDTINPQAEDIAKELFGKTLLHFNQQTPLAIQEIFAIQAATKESMPFPSSQVVYTPATDVIPASKAFLAGTISYESYFASLAFYARPDTLGFYFATEQFFDEFKEWLQNEIQLIQSVLPMETNQMFADFNQLNLNSLTESLLIRNNDDENNEEYSFARCIIYYLMKYCGLTSNDCIGILPFRLDELINPKSIVFVNVEKHAHATSKQIANEWALINQSIQNKPKVVNTKKLKKLTATQRTLQKVQQHAQYNMSRSQQQVQRAQQIKFSKTQSTSIDLTKRVKKIMNKMAQVNRSDNSFKDIKMTYQKPNRRNPDDFNKPCKIVSTKYKPDIHLYIDTSGSISERNYQDAVKACIKMAKKLNVNLYFNSFSHVLSQATKLNTKDKTQNQIYKQFQRVPKVTGGTDYEQIWHYINRSKKRKRELSIIMTDFEWFAPNQYVEHPKNLYYAPISVAPNDWNNLTHWAEEFCKSMKHIDLKTRSKVLF